MKNILSKNCAGCDKKAIYDAVNKKSICRQCVVDSRKMTPEQKKEKQKKYVSEYRKNNIEKIREYDKLRRTPEKNRRNNLKHNFNITLEDYNNLLESQNGKCAICWKDKSDFGKSLAIDHCHKTNVIRGILCFHCNSAIGKFKDDCGLLKRAIEYLQKHIGCNDYEI